MPWKRSVTGRFCLKLSTGSEQRSGWLIPAPAGLGQEAGLLAVAVQAREAVPGQQ